MVTHGGVPMTSLNWRHKLGSFLSNLFPVNGKGEVEDLKREIENLRGQLKAAQCVDRHYVARELETVRTDLEDADHRDLLMMKQEVEILRNEMQDNIAAIHRLEILTLNRRINLLTEFGKELPPTTARRTRKSLKPHGYSFGIITNGQRNGKLAKLIESIRVQNIPKDSCEILVAGCVDGLSGMEGIRTFPMEQAAAEGRLGAMRNVLAQGASFNKFVSLDDDFLLHPNWADAVEGVKGDFDVATSIIVNPDLSRYCDWVNIIENYTFLRAYHETFDKCQYLTGGYGIYKDFIFLEHSWNDDLGFYQGEDVSFSRRLFDAGFQLKFIPKAIVMHDDERYRQKGYGVIRLKSAEERNELLNLSLRLEKLCPRTLA
jgi:hypothetical protein